MLISLQIENFALVDRLDLELGAGLNVLTGETGAGKSIILDALDAALGGKMSSRVIRTGAERAVVEATFDLDPGLLGWLAAQQIELVDDVSLVCSRELVAALDAALGGKMSSRVIRTGAERAVVEATFDLDPGLLGWLAEQQIELVDDVSLVCSRELVAGQSGVRSRSRVNGVTVNKAQMDELRDRLLEITAQGQTLLLGKASLQREWLDGFGGVQLVEQRESVADVYMAAQQAFKALDKRRQFEQQRLQQLDLFEYQAKELTAANLSDPDELTQLEQERQRLSHSVELQQQSYQVYQALYQNDRGSPACADLLGNAETTLIDMTRYDSSLQPILELVIEAMAQVEEAGRQINAYGEALETDPDRLQTRHDPLRQLFAAHFRTGD